MRILIISRYPPFPGGRENFVFELSKQLSSDNKVLVITPDQENLDCGNLIIRKYPETTELLEEIIKDFQPDIINSHTFYLSKDVADIAGDMNISFGITLHGDQFAIGDKQRQDIVSDVVKISNFVINVSENGKMSIINNVSEIDENKLHVINNGINFETFNKDLKKYNLIHREEFDIELEKKIILIPTRIAVYKGLNFLVDFILENKAFLEENNILFLASIPDYPFSDQEKELYDSLKIKIKDADIAHLIKFIFLKYEEVVKAYSVADLFFLPSEKEQLPVSILEAMACEVPIIATRVGGVPELLEHGKEGYIVDFGDTSVVRKSIEKYLITKNYTEIQRNAHNKVLKKYSIKKIANTYQELYKRYKR